MPSNMLRKSMPESREHQSPLGQGRCYERLDGIEVKLLYWPEETRFKRMVYKATLATRGSDIQEEDSYDERVVEEAFAGGLNQCLEWATVVFEISGVSRGLTHELVRTRKASFAQQSMRHTNMGNANVRMPEEIANGGITVQNTWLQAIAAGVKSYQQLVDLDVPFQDARTVLPIATETYIIAAYPLSEFINTYAYRSCYMFYPEIVGLFRMMKMVLSAKCPWLEPYILTSCEKTRPNGSLPHMCTYQGWERVEGQCPLAWAQEHNRVWKSSRFGG